MVAATNPLYWRKTTILSKLEDPAGYATDAAPDAAHALRIKEAEVVPLAGQTVDRGYVRSHMGASEQTHVGVHRTTKFGCELAGSGTAGVVPGYGPAVLRSCGVAEVVRTSANTVQASPGTPAGGNAGAWTYTLDTPYVGAVARAATITCTTGGASGAAKVTVSAPAVGGIAAYEVTDVTVTTGVALVLPGGAAIIPTMVADFGVGDSWTIALAPAWVQYSPVSGDFEHSTLYFFKDGHLYKMRGTRGNAVLSFAEKEVPKITFDMAGLWERPIAQTPPTPAPAGFVKGLVFNKANTPTARLFGVDIVPKSLEINLGMAFSYKDRPNQEMVHITDNKQTGTITFQYPKLADFDVETAAHDDMLGAFELVHGISAGNIIELNAGRVQITEPKMSEDEGLIMCTANLTFVPSDAGNDAVVVTVR